jgi:hypothetical protein
MTPKSHDSDHKELKILYPKKKYTIIDSINIDEEISSYIESIKGISTFL